mmetsp:Transcript_69293/g.124936  ORF Transcript_69293/g.124936 Transcript_69293/m.124936 type:complete len:105 (+) Transcript_69293:91-405(+)
MKRIFVAAMLRLKEAELAAQTCSLVPPEEVENYTNLLRSILQQELGEDHRVKSSAARLVCSKCKLLLDSVDRGSPYTKEDAQQPCAPGEGTVVVALVLLVESLP